MPLRKEPVALWMLLLGDPEHDEPAVSDILLNLLVPGRHGPATTPSPRGKVDEKDFLSAKLRQRYRSAGRNVGQYKIRMRLTHTRRIASRIGRAGYSTNASASQRNQVQIQHCSDPRGHSLYPLSQVHFFDCIYRITITADVNCAFAHSLSSLAVG